MSGSGANQGVTLCRQKHQPLRNHENVLVFYRAKRSTNPQMWQSAPYRGFRSMAGATIGEVYGNAVPSIGTTRGHSLSAVRLRLQDGEGVSPTQKTVAPFEYLIRTYTDEGMVVLDNTARQRHDRGRAENARRQWRICIERDPDYTAKAIERIRGCRRYGERLSPSASVRAQPCPSLGRHRCSAMVCPRCLVERRHGRVRIVVVG